MYAEVEYLKAGLGRLRTAQIVVDDVVNLLVKNVFNYDTNIHCNSSVFLNSINITFLTISQYVFLLSNISSNSQLGGAMGVPSTSLTTILSYQEGHNNMFEIFRHTRTYYFDNIVAPSACMTVRLYELKNNNF